MPVLAALTKSHATLTSQAKPWIYGNVTTLPNGEKIQVAETMDGDIVVRHFGVGLPADSGATVTTRADGAANTYEASATTLGRR